jgi:hypothetical protein
VLKTGIGVSINDPSIGVVSFTSTSAVAAVETFVIRATLPSGLSADGTLTVTMIEFCGAHKIAPSYEPKSYIVLNHPNF